MSGLVVMAVITALLYLGIKVSISIVKVLVFSLLIIICVTALMSGNLFIYW